MTYRTVYVALGRYFELAGYEYDPEPKRYVSLVKQPTRRTPIVSLSCAASAYSQYAVINYLIFIMISIIIISGSLCIILSTKELFHFSDNVSIPSRDATKYCRVIFIDYTIKLFL